MHKHKESSSHQQSHRSTDQLVWYCCYGSNLNHDRFNVYIHGGTPKNSCHRHIGCRNRSAPIRDTFHTLHHVELLFAKESTSWGGGGAAFIRQQSHNNNRSTKTPTTSTVNFLNDHHVPNHLGTDEAIASVGTIVRLYLITVDQFIDVVAQENGIHDRERIQELEQCFCERVLPQTRDFHSVSQDIINDSENDNDSGNDETKQQQSPSIYETVEFLTAQRKKVLRKLDDCNRMSDYKDDENGDHDESDDENNLELQCAVHDISKSWYDMLVYLGTRDNYPIFSFTNYAMNHVWQEHEIPFNAPSSAYLYTIYRGIKQANFFGGDEELYVDYFYRHMSRTCNNLDTTAGDNERQRRQRKQQQQRYVTVLDKATIRQYIATHKQTDEDNNVGSGDE